MKTIFENKFGFTEEQVNIPFILGNSPIGVVSEVNKDSFTVQIFDRFIGLEMADKRINAIYLSEEQQMSFEEMINLAPEKFIDLRSCDKPEIDIDLKSYKI